jgi:hypothetical protein
MKLLWRRVLPIFLENPEPPLRMAAGFDDAVASLEKIVWKPEQILWAQLGASGAGRDADGSQQAVRVQFQPP